MRRGFLLARHWRSMGEPVPRCYTRYRFFLNIQLRLLCRKSFAFLREFEVRPYKLLYDKGGLFLRLRATAIALCDLRLRYALALRGAPRQSILRLHHLSSSDGFQ